MEVKVIWHNRKGDMPNMSQVPAGEIHIWHCNAKPNVRIEARGIPLCFSVSFYEEHTDGTAHFNLLGGHYNEDSISKFFHYLKIARKEAKIKFEGKI